MTTTASCGYNGSCSLGGELLAWTAKKTVDAIDATNTSGSGNREWIGCLDSWEGTITSNIPVALRGLHTSVEFINSKGTYTGDIIITSMAKKVEVADKIGYTYNWVSTGLFS